ncbi:MAG: phytanoyl-CoA dioxygenase family protein, partial [Polyangia bacterium]
GRVRLHFTRAMLDGGALPEVVRRFADDPASRALAAAYFDAGASDMVARVPYYIAEVMTPAEKVETWHVDCLRPTMKCFLLLEDVGEEQAPLRYIDGSHLVDEERRQLFYRIARGGLGAAYFDADAAAAYDRAALHLTAPAGTLLAFDSRGIHAGSRCRNGTRVALVNGYRPPRALRLSPRLFRDPEQTPYPWERVTNAQPRA